MELCGSIVDGKLEKKTRRHFTEMCKQIAA